MPTGGGKRGGRIYHQQDRRPTGQPGQTMEGLVGCRYRFIWVILIYSLDLAYILYLKRSFVCTSVHSVYSC